MKKILIVCFSYLMFTGLVSAQHDVQISQHLLSRTHYNPAAAGASLYGNITGIARQQYTGFTGAPQTGLLNFDMLLRNSSSGIGLSVVYDKFGPLMSYNPMINYAYHIKLGENQHLSLGVAGGVFLRQYDASNNIYENIGDPIENYDSDQQYMAPDANVGAEYQLENWVLGASATHIPQFFEDETVLNPTTQYYAYSRYRFEVGRYWDVTPGLASQFDGYSVHNEINAVLHYLKMFWVGGSYRFSDVFDSESIVPMAGLQLTDFVRIGYAYDHNLSKLNNYNSGSHEIMLQLRFKTRHHTSRTPRFAEW
ncbi:MAG: PorP/SprF family type IX secretion system membrane protein [Paludibacteraceae bacterium]|nr:PorP/SprF family type IX secretion system membrane protein [Paludibacteraceae bacterium]MBP6284394.1 PorP/SprF family type IX secretion system membrane protein [Paludibacteraceae bacterium]